MRIAIVDRSLVDDRGHHLELQKSFTTALAEAGVDIVWIANKRFIEHDRITATRHFSYSAYSRDNIHDHMPQTTQEYEILFSSATQSGIDAFFIHTASQVDYCALASIAHRYRHVAILVCTPYYPLYMPGGGDPTSVVQAMITLQRIPNVKLFTETPELSDKYTALGVQAPHMGIPVRPSLSGYSYLKMLSTKYDSVSIAYLGAARAEKGFSSFVELVNAICSDSRFNDKVSRIQASIFHPINKPSKEVLCAISSISKMSERDPRINLLNSIRPNNEYARILQETTLIWLGYNPRCYANGRGSGILIDSLVNGCSFATSRGMSAQYYLFGNGFLLEKSKERNLEAFHSFVNRLAEARNAARSMSQRITHEYSASRIAHKVLSASRSSSKVSRLQ